MFLFISWIYSLFWVWWKSMLCLLSCLHQTIGYIDKHSIRIILMCEIFQALHRILFGHIFCYYFKCGPWCSSNTITLNFVKNADSQSWPRPLNYNLHFKQDPHMICELKFGKHWGSQLRKHMECNRKVFWFLVIVIRQWLLVFTGSWTAGNYEISLHNKCTWDLEHGTLPKSF